MFKIDARKIVTLGLTCTLALSPLALAACGSSSSGSSDSSAATAEETTDDTEATTEDTSSDTSTDSEAPSYSIAVSDIDEAYMGASEASETIYYVGSNDLSKVGIFFLDADQMAHVSFMGQATVTQQDGENLITVTDELTGNTITFSGVVNDDGTITIDMGSDLGKAILAPCDISEAVDAIQTIQGYTTQVS